MLRSGTSSPLAPCCREARKLALAFLLLGHFATAASGGDASEVSCTKGFDQLTAGSKCKSTWSKITTGDHRLYASEPAVGYAWVVRQKEEHFSSPKTALKWFKKHSFPAVLGPNGFYLTDSHHHAAAIQLTGSKAIWDLDLEISVLCDLRRLHEKNFWSEMQRRNYAYLANRASPYELPSPVPPSALPRDWALTSFTDNVWRSVAGFASHYADDQLRCYIKTCSYFVDYQWAWVINLATEVKPELWPDSGQAADFKQRLHAQPYPTSASSVDLGQWTGIAESVLPLCHSASIQDYPLPPVFHTDMLQGWSAVPVPDDPDCPYKTCSTALASQRGIAGAGDTSRTAASVVV